MRGNEKAAVVDDPVKVLATGLGRPANPLVTIRQAPSGGAERQSGNEFAPDAADEVAQLCSTQRTRPQIMETIHQLVPLNRESRCSEGKELNVQGLELVQGGVDGRGDCGLRGGFTTSRGRQMSWRRQMPGPSQLSQSLASRHQSRLAGGGNPPRLRAQEFCQLTAGRCRRFGFDLLKNLGGDLTPGDAHAENLGIGRHGVQREGMWNMTSPPGEGWGEGARFNPRDGWHGKVHG